MKGLILIRLTFCSPVVRLSVNFPQFYTRPIKLDTKHLCVNRRGIKRTRPVQRGDNNEIVKKTIDVIKSHWANFNQTWQKSLFGKREIQVCSNKGPLPLSRGDNNEIVKKKNHKNIDVIKSSFPNPLGQFQPNLAKITVW